MADTKMTGTPTLSIDPDTGKRILLVLGLLLELLMMAVGLWPAAWLVLYFAPVAHTPGQWVLIVLGAVLVFNVGYLVALLVLRRITPRPKEGHHAFTSDGRLPRVIVVFMLNVLLLKARFDPPWAAMFSSVLTRVFPLGPLFARWFGPRTTSVTMGDATFFLDPHHLEIGKNVELGFGCTIVAHHFDNRGLYIRRVTIGDRATIGGWSVIMAGVQVSHHAVVGARSVVPPDTKIGPYEYWAGAPARKIKDLRSDVQSPDDGSSGQSGP